MKKNRMNMFMAAAVLLAMSVALAACGGGVKSLAKQTYQLEQDALKAGDDLAKTARVAAKAAAVAAKVEKLSESAKAEYAAELLRLHGAGGGSSSSSSSSSSGTSSDGKKYVTADKAENFVYDLTADGTGVVIKDMTKPSNGDYYNVIKIPAKIEGYPVVEVQKFNYRASELSVTFPDTVTILGEKLLEGRKMKTVKLPPKITVIPSYFFQYSSIAEITIPSGVTRIESNAFADSKLLTTITIPDSVTEIGYRAFYLCPELTTVKLPSHPITYFDYTRYPSVDDQILEDLGDHNYKIVKSDNGAFRDCPKLSLAMRKAITDSGYTGGF